MREGIEFHTVGAATLNARSPADFSLHFGTSRLLFDLDLVFLVCGDVCSISFKYSGPSPFSVLNVLTAILYCMRNLTGSQ